MKCQFAGFCGKRMALGDRENGCSVVDEVSCDPTLAAGTKTAPGGDVDQPYRRCTNCYRTRTRRAWNAGMGPRMCDCGSYSWTPIIL